MIARRLLIQHSLSMERLHLLNILKVRLKSFSKKFMNGLIGRFIMTKALTNIIWAIHRKMADSITGKHMPSK